MVIGSAGVAVGANARRIEPDGHAFKARLIGILHTVAIAVEPDPIAQGQRRRVTERKQIEEEMQEFEARLRAEEEGVRAGEGEVAESRVSAG